VKDFWKSGARWQISHIVTDIFMGPMFSQGVMPLQKTIKVTGFLSTSMIDDIGHCKHWSFVLS
jgi:hypothetical protein